MVQPTAFRCFASPSGRLIGVDVQWDPIKPTQPPITISAMTKGQILHPFFFGAFSWTACRLTLCSATGSWTAIEKR